MSETLEGKTAVVTGSSSGIGRVIALELADAGASVVTNARSAERAEATANEIRDAGGTAVAAEADVSVYPAVERLIETAVSAFGGVDIMVNNAAIQRRGDTETMPLDDWHRVLDVNLNGVYYGARAAGTEMIDAGTGGNIINISSVMGEHGQRNPGRTPYNTAKGGVNNLTRCLAVEWAEHDIHVNAIAPGYIETEDTEASLDDAPFSTEEIADRTPLGRWGSPAEIANCVTFLACGDHFLTGEIIRVDGGWTALA